MKKNMVFLIYFIFLSIGFSFSIQSAEINRSHNNVGVILGRVVNIRIKPDINSRIVSIVKENEYVKIIKWTKRKIKINGFTDKWVKILSKTGKVGYIFGAFLFDLKYLYLNKWTQPNYARLFNTTMIFKRNFMYIRIIKNVIDDSQTNRGLYFIDYKEIGEFYLTGRKLILLPKKQFILKHSKRVKIWEKVKRIKNINIINLIYKELYLFKCENFKRVFLTRRKVTVVLNRFCADYGGYYPLK